MSINMWPFKKDYEKETNERCFSMAQEVLRLIGTKEKLLFGGYTQKEANEEYKDLVQEIKKIMLEKKLLLEEVNYVMKLVLQPIEATKFILNENFNKLLLDAEEKFWGKSHDDITVEDLDDVLKK